MPRLLVIDDDEGVRRNICAFLKDSGFEVIEAESGTVGISLFETEHPDLVLCDLRMPDLDGINVIKNVTAAGTNTPVIVISGFGEIDDVVQALRLGAADYLMKPIKDLEVLEYSVRRSLKQAELVSENARYSAELESSNLQLRQSLDLLRVDQQAGRHVQTRLLPKTPFRTSSYVCQHKIVPSLYLSGDFVDYWETEDDELIFYIADVSGHGASSAFVTVLLMYLAKDIARRQHLEFGNVSPGAMLARLNTEMIRANLQKHVTMFLGVINQKNNSLEYAAAGHYPMPIIGEGDDYSYLEARSFPIGVREGAEYEDVKLELNSQFTLNLFSDGVLELLQARSLDEKDVLLLALSKDNKGHYEGLYQALGLGEVADAPDDVALLTIERLPG